MSDTDKERAKTVNDAFSAKQKKDRGMIDILSAITFAEAGEFEEAGRIAGNSA
jgi:hypothetical protein